PPAPPKFPSPAPGAVINPIPLTLGWGSNGGEYWVQLFNWDLSLRADRSWSTDTAWYVGPLPEGLYYWRVWSRYGPGLEGDWSPFWPFTVRNLPYSSFGPAVEKRIP
ncbi:MAG: hypothetical protein HYX89_00685, partial [Chloroflexi bacterium]|nr:hypothetical protein [Chloroflexota bacterium]